MGIFSWLFGKRETPAASADQGRMRPTVPSAEPPAPTTNSRSEASPADNLRRWRESGQPRDWIEARKGQWDHDAWLTLLHDLEQSSFWPMNPDDVGLVLEEARREWLNRH